MEVETQTFMRETDLVLRIIWDYVPVPYIITVKINEFILCISYFICTFVEK